MTIREDRILRLLRRFYGNLKDYPRSYALLNVNEVVSSRIPYESWGTLDEDKQRELNIMLDQKEEELEDMNVRIIWYSAPMDDKLVSAKHESAKHELFEYILRKERQKWEQQRQEEIEKIRKTKLTKDNRWINT